MNKLIELEKKFEVAIAHLEEMLAIDRVEPSTDALEIENNTKLYEETKSKRLADRILELEKAAESDAREIDQLIKKLKEILHDND